MYTPGKYLGMIDDLNQEESSSPVQQYDWKKIDEDIKTSLGAIDTPDQNQNGDATAGRVETAFNTLLSSAAKGVSSDILKGFSQGGEAVDTLFGSKPASQVTPAKDRTLYQIGQSIEDFIDKHTDINPEYKDEFVTSVLPQAFGSTASFLAGGALGGALKMPKYLAPMAQGVLTSGIKGGYEDYQNTIKAQGGFEDPTQRAKATFYNAPVGALEALPVERAITRAGEIIPKLPMTKTLSHIDDVTGGFISRKVLKEGFKGGLEELSQEVLQQLGQNLIANGVVNYDPDRDTLQGTLQSGAAGGTVGFLMSALASSLGGKRLGKIQQATFEKEIGEDVAKNLGMEDPKQAITAVRDEFNKTKEIDGVQINTGDIRSIYSKALTYYNIGLSQHEANGTIPDYVKHVDALRSKLESYINPGEDKEADPVKKLEAETVLKKIADTEEMFRQTIHNKENGIIKGLWPDMHNSFSSWSSEKQQAFLAKHPDIAKQITAFNKSTETKVLNKQLANAVKRTNQMEAFKEGVPVPEDKPEGMTPEEVTTLRTKSYVDEYSKPSVVPLETKIEPTGTTVPPTTESAPVEAPREDLDTKFSNYHERIAYERDSLQSELYQHLDSISQVKKELDNAIAIGDEEGASQLSSELNNLKTVSQQTSSRLADIVRNYRAPTTQVVGNNTIESYSDESGNKVEVLRSNTPISTPSQTSESDFNKLFPPKEDSTTPDKFTLDDIPDTNTLEDTSSQEAGSSVTRLPPSELGLGDNFSFPLADKLLLSPEHQKEFARYRSELSKRGLEPKVVKDENGNRVFEVVKKGSSTPTINKDTDPYSDMYKDMLPRDNHVEYSSVLDKITTKMGLSKQKSEREDHLFFANDKVRIHLIRDFKNFDFHNIENLKYQGTSDDKGLHVQRSDGSTDIYLNSSNFRNVNELKGTFAHEVIGHYGARALLGEARYDQFLMNMLSSTPKLRESILTKTSSRWQHYIHKFNLDNPDYQYTPTNSYPGKYFDMKSGKTKETPIHHTVLIRLADEYFAEQAKKYMLEEGFLEKEVGLGLKSSKERTALRKQRETWMTKFINGLRHMIRGILGSWAEKSNVSDRDLRNMVAASADNLFMNTPTNFHLPYEIASTPSVAENPNFGSGSIPGVMGEVALDVKDEIERPTTSSPYIHNLDSYGTLISSNFANLTKTWRSETAKKIEDHFNQKPGLLKAFKTLGNLQYKEAYKGIQEIYKGLLDKNQEKAIAIGNTLSKLNNIEKAAVYKYFTDKNADIDDLKFSLPMKNMIKSYKADIEKLGDYMHDLGLIKTESWEKNRGAFLHTVYWQYIDAYKGAGKRPSLMTWAKERNLKLSDEDKFLLGQIKDPSFLVADTFGTLARDHILLDMFNSLKNMKINGQTTHWVLTANDKIPSRFGNLSFQDAWDTIKANEQRIESWNTTGPYFGTTEKADYDLLVKETTELKNNLEEIERKAVQDAYNQYEHKNLNDPKDINNFLRDNYTRAPDSKRWGALRNQYIRNEIADDLGIFMDSSSLANKSLVDKMILPGGKLEKGNQLWKALKTIYNPGTWGRNIASNFVLLDISSSTPFTILFGRATKEMVNYFSKGNPSEWFKLAQDYGSMSGTYSANELSEFVQEFKKELDLKASNDGSGNLLHNLFGFTDPHWQAVSRVLEKFPKNYAAIEGIFKSVAFRDYVEQWEKENKSQYPGGHKSLSNDQKQVLYTKAMSHANDALFDYSSVPKIIRDIRRTPFGSPFITFTYKAAGASIRGAIKHPVKFAKWYALPMIVMQATMASFDWDDDDISSIKNQMSEFYRDNPSAVPMPWKDDLGRPVVNDLGYLIPHNQYQVIAKKIINDYNESPDAVTSPGLAAQALWTIGDQLGFLGGPVPTLGAAMITNKDSFTGRDIATPGTSTDQQLTDWMKYTYNLIAPGWLGTYGWMNKMWDTFGPGTPQVNQFGDVKWTPGQVLSEGTGFASRSVDKREAVIRRTAEFDRKISDITKERSRIIRDRNELDKASKIKEINERLKRMQQIKGETLRSISSGP